MNVEDFAVPDLDNPPRLYNHHALDVQAHHKYNGQKFEHMNGAGHPMFAHAQFGQPFVPHDGECFPPTFKRFTE